MGGVRSTRHIKRCPNCGGKLARLVGEWVCVECEYHDAKGKPRKESFR